MADAAAQFRLMAWLSPAFPVGGFSYSHGLEAAVDIGLVGDADGLEAWIADLVAHGSGWNDAVLLAESWRRAASGGDVATLAELAEAMAGSRERHLESTAQGAAFLAAASAWPHPRLEALGPRAPYCVAVGCAAGAHGVPLAAALGAFLQAFATNLVQAAIRLSVVGQVDAVALVARLEPMILDVAARAAGSDLDALGSATFVSEVVAMRHETQYSRLFRS